MTQMFNALNIAKKAQKYWHFKFKFSQWGAMKLFPKTIK